MVSIKKKAIKRGVYLYAEHSFRLPDGTIKKISKLIKNPRDIKNKELREWFFKSEIRANQEYAQTFFKPDKVLTKEKIAEIEAIKVEYKYLIKNLTKSQFKDVLDRFTVNFTYESNAIEGNSLTLKDVALFLHENIIPRGRELREVYETRNTREANELLFSNKIKITQKDIIKIHSILVRDTGIPTGFKRFPNYVLMRHVQTTPPEKVAQEMQDLINFYNLNKGREHPLKLAADFHGRFERIHPFEDGNGRIGRLLINAILLDNKYPPLIIRKTMRQSYFSALEANDYGHKTRLLRFVLEKFKDTFEKFFKVYLKYL